jgi:hypothetical protein
MTTSILNTLGTKAPINSPQFAGIPECPDIDVSGNINILQIPNRGYVDTLTDEIDTRLTGEINLKAPILNPAN